MESVPGAVATGLAPASSDAATNDRFRTRLRHYPVATASGTDLIPQSRHYRLCACIECTARTDLSCFPQMRKVNRLILAALVISSAAICHAQNQPQTKRNDRPPETGATTPPRKENKKPPDPTRYWWEFTKPEFLVSHIVIEHDASGRGKITFEHRGEATPIVEPIELSISALSRVLGLWSDLRFLDSNENYQTAKSFAHLGTYHLRMDDGQRKRTAEFNWSDNKRAWTLTNEYRRVSNQAILVFDLKLAREMQPLNAPGLMDEMEWDLTRGELSDPNQLVPLLKDLLTDERIPLIARNHADRLLKKIEK